MERLALVEVLDDRLRQVGSHHPCEPDFCDAGFWLVEPRVTKKMCGFLAKMKRVYTRPHI